MEPIVWQPHKRQQDFLELPDTIFEALYGGAAGGGKTDTLFMLPIVRKFFQHPRFKGIIFRRTFGELDLEVIKRTKEYYPHAGGTYNESKRRWTFPSGAEISFGHCEHEDDVHKYDTAEYQYMAFDELTSFSRYQYIYLAVTRVRGSDDSLPKIVRSGTNPGNVGHQWVRERFVEPSAPNTIVQDSKTGKKRIFIPCTAHDNPYIDKDYINRLEMLDEAEKASKLRGDWYSFSGQVFSDFRETRSPDEPENAVHVVDEFKIPDYWPKLLSVDWGFAAKTVGLWGAVSPQNRLFIYRQYEATQKKIVEWCSDIKNIVQDEKVKKAVLCRSAWQNRGEELLLAEQFRNITGLTPEYPDNNRIAGKMAIQEFLRWKPKVTTKRVKEDFDFAYAQRILRNKGLEAYDLYLKEFEPEELESTLPKLQIFRSCESLIKTIPLCIYEKNTTSGKLAEDVREFNGDDDYDALRYLVLASESFFGKAQKEETELAKVDNVIKAFEETKDWTAYYRSMERLEFEKKAAYKPVRLLSRRRYG